MAKTDGPTNRELFNKLMDVMDKQTAIQQQTAEAMTSLGEQVGTNTKTVNSKMWHLMFALITIAGFSIGLKLWPA